MVIWQWARPHSSDGSFERRCGPVPGHDGAYLGIDMRSAWRAFFARFIFVPENSSLLAPGRDADNHQRTERSVRGYATRSRSLV
jgi:hypothetical protein